ncbi:MAG TPA: metallophosphoesterase [Micromonosporaceae bacterium]|nr:metallophosphoesterase [Micromonosporaceae bacterium]
MARIAGRERDATLLHVSDTRFGARHRSGGEDGSLAGSLVLDLRQLLEETVPRVGLVVLSGDITERGLRSEFDQARGFVDALCEATGLGHDRVVVVPGNHDVNQALSMAYFSECEAEEVAPRPPYAKKWRFYQEFVTWLHGAAAFTEDQPYRVHRFDDLGLAVAALNSTMEESHRDGDHYGSCGVEQLRWAEARLREAGGCVRVGVVHHNARRRAVADDENLRDADDLTQILGPRLDLLLHGHTHNGAQDRLADALVLATGSAAVVPARRPDEVPSQYQILRLRPDRVTRWARQWDAQRRCWIADTRISPDGNQWHVDIPFAPDAWRGPIATEAEEKAALVGRRSRGDGPPDFLAQVEYVTRRDVGEGQIERRRKDSPGLDYLVVVRPAAPLRCVGVVDGRLDAKVLGQFDTAVFAPLRERGDAELVLVHHGPQDPDLRMLGLEHGVRVKTWNEYNDLLDPSAYRAWLRTELLADQQYPQQLYLPQRFREIDRWGTAFSRIEEDLVSRVYDSILEEDGRFFLILGDAGFGKSFLVRRLAHLILGNDRTNVTPIVVYLRDRDKRQTIEEMVSNVLIPSRAVFNADRFEHSLEAGTLALLVDGYDEFAIRVGYQSAAAQLNTFIRALRGRAKVLLTTRPNHFRSADQATTALFDSLRTVHDGQVYQLEPFDEGQQRAFLVRSFELAGRSSQEAAALAQRWMHALGRVDNLPELAKTPRMLSFMVEDLSLGEIESAATTATVTAAALYQRLVDLWLAGEASKLDPVSERTVTSAQRQLLLEQIAFSMWRSGERDLTETALQQVARDNLDLPRIDLTVDQAAQLIGGRTLLQVDANRWRFVHQSIWEYLLANYLAGRLKAGEDLDQLGDAELTQLTIRFLRDLAPEEATAWASRIAGGER